MATVQGVGAALSPALGGLIAQAIGFRAAFLILGCFSLGSLALWILAAPILRPACGRPSEGGAEHRTEGPVAAGSPVRL